MAGRIKEVLEGCADAINVTAACEGAQDLERGFMLGTMPVLDVFEN
ncbi:MAG: hypothetical protein J6N15_05110 [Ruminiclostridium sp.]|nr:hypothetical protein [Ruminiclostridium sp.]